MGNPKIIQYLYRADQLGAQWKLLEEREARLEKEYKRLGGIIQTYLRAHGSRPHRAPGMLAALGAVYELTAISSRKTTVDPALAEKFLKACPRRIARRALRREARYVVAAGAEKFLLREAAARQLEMWRRAVKSKKQAPRIRVRELKSKQKHLVKLPARKAAA